jgi:hypothetical protein
MCHSCFVDLVLNREKEEERSGADTVMRNLKRAREEVKAVAVVTLMGCFGQTSQRKQL